MASINELNFALGSYLTAIEERFRVREFAIVESEAELLAQLGEEEDFGTVFNSWLRFSRHTNTGLADLRSNEAELDRWSYNATTGKLHSTINSDTYIGFVSPESYDNYVFEAILDSTNNDDDDITLIAAFAQDSNGNYHTLDFLRAGRGTSPARILKNFRNLSSKAIHNIRDGLIWMDGTVAVEAKPEDTGGWGTIPNGVLCKITREGDILTFETSQFGNITEYFEPAKRVVDLSEDSALEVFRGPQRFGYGCSSQNQATWEVLRRPGARAPVLDLANNNLHTWDGDNWIVSAFSGSSALLRDKAFYVNPNTGKLFYLDKRISSPIRVGSR